MIAEFTYIHAANLTLHVRADIRFGYPAQVTGPPEHCYPAEDDEVEIEEVTFFTCDNGKDIIKLDFEWDDIQVAGRWLDELLQEAALEAAS